MAISDTEQSEIQKYGCTKAERDRIQRQHSSEKWTQTPFGAFSQQRRDARKHGIPWELTFHQWWEIWTYSGRWDQRGRSRGRYCMSRLCHDGPYRYDNVHIIPFEESVRDAIEMRAAGVDGYRAAGESLTEKDKQWISQLRESLP